jgi:uncharacterized Fe-S cluster-containing radical SAM superfamily enzyme
MDDIENDKNSDEANRDIVELKEAKQVIDISKTDILDISGLDDEAKQQLQVKASEAAIDLKKKAQEANIDVQGTKVNLDNLNDTVKDATREGTSITVTHTQTTSVGRTEVVMGNTERAASGKISRSGSGLDDNTTKMLIGAGIIAIIVAMIIANGG